MPGVSDSAIPTWNIRSDNYFEALFSFAQSNLHDDAVIIVKESKRFQDLGFYLSRHSFIWNFTDEVDQMMRGNVPWRGPWEKHQSFYQMLIEAFTKEGDIVMNWQANTSNSCFSIVAIQSRFKHPCIVVNAFMSY